VIAAKAVAFTEANTPEFKVYARQIVANARALAAACIKESLEVVTGGTDNHLMLIDVTPFGLTGRQAESALRDCGVTLNRNSVPFDANGPWYTSGLRVGTPAVTTLGMGETEMREIAEIVKLVLANTVPTVIESGANAGERSKAKYTIEKFAHDQALARVHALLDRFPVYPELDLAFLLEHFG
jgi:glycine hydroxymethyltransferase